MCIIVDDIERKYREIPEIRSLCEDWRQERMYILENTLEFARIQWPLLEIDRRFQNILEYILDFLAIETAP